MCTVRRMKRPPLLVFVHIPKTAGTTVTKVLSLNEPGERTRALGNVFKGGGGVKRGARFERLRDEKGMSQLQDVRVITGHVPLGIRERLPKDREVRCVTFLREPADRTLSHYFQIRRTAERDRAQGRDRPKRGSLGLTALPPKPTLADMLDGGYVHDNLQTRMLSGLPEPFGEVTDEMLEKAKRNLSEEFVFFGLVERFDESLLLAKRRLGLGSVFYKASGSGASSGRVNTGRPRGDEIPKKLLRAAEDCNRYDIELYRYAKELFNEAPDLEELEFQVELAAFRAARADGEIDLDVPPPSGFGGDEEAWGMLLGARARLLSDEWELAEIKALVHELGQGQSEILENLRGFRSMRKRVARRDEGAVSTEVLQLVGRIAAALRADGRATPAKRRASGARRSPSRGRAGSKKEVRSSGG
jgi:hypothetical protein